MRLSGSGYSAMMPKFGITRKELNGVTTHARLFKVGPEEGKVRLEGTVATTTIDTSGTSTVRVQDPRRKETAFRNVHIPFDEKDENKSFFLD